MAHNTRIRVFGLWVSVTAIDPDELETFDLRQFQSINGDLGGTWAPADEIVIGGLGLGVTGPFSANDARTIVMATDGLLTFDDAGSDEPAILLGEFRTIEMAADSAINLASGSGINLNAGSSMVIDGLVLATATSDTTYQSGSVLNIESGADVVIDAGANVANSATLLQGGQFARVGATARSVQSSRAGSWTNSNQLQGVEYDYIEIINTSASMVTLTLKIATAPVPLIDERIRVRVSGAGAGGKTIINEGSAANLAVVSGANAANFEFVFDGVAWRVFSNVGGGITLGADAY